MPLHALVTRQSSCPAPATALAGLGVTRPGERAPCGTLTLLAPTAGHPGVTVVTGGTPGQRTGGGEGKGGVNVVSL